MITVELSDRNSDVSEEVEGLIHGTVLASFINIDETAVATSSKIICENERKMPLWM